MITKTKTELILASLIAAALAILGLSQINRNERIEKAKNESLQLNHKAFEGKDSKWISQHKRNLIEFLEKPRQLKGYLKWQAKEFSSSTINTSQHGYRLFDKCSQQWPPSDNKFNVFLVGASRTFGLGVEDSGTIGASLQRALNEAEENTYCVYNMGQLGYMPEQELNEVMSIVNLGLKHRFAVISISGVNEGENPTSDSIDMPINRIQQSLNKGGSLSKHIGYKINKLTGTIKRRLNLKNNHAIESNGITAKQREGTAEFSLKRFCNTATAMATTTRANHGIFVKVLEPNPTWPKVSDAYSFKSKFNSNIKRKSDLFYDAINQRGCPNWEGQVNFINLSSLPQSKLPNAYADWGHYSSRLNEDIGVIISKNLLEEAEGGHRRQQF